MPDPVVLSRPTAMAVPWYKSKIVVGIVTIVVSQVIKRVQAKYNIDLTLWGTAVPDIVGGVIDGLGVLSAAFALHARASADVPIPPVVTMTQGKADRINALVNLAPVTTPSDEKKS